MASQLRGRRETSLKGLRPADKYRRLDLHGPGIQSHFYNCPLCPEVPYLLNSITSLVFTIIIYYWLSVSKLQLQVKYSRN